MTPEGELNDAGLSGTAEKKVRSAVKIRDHIRMMLNAELEGCTDERLGVLQAALNQLYDNHVKQFGPIYKDRELGKIFNNDSGYAILLSLEEVEDNKLVGKSDIFTKRTISAQTVPTHVDTATDALMVSIQEKGKVNIPYMAELTGKSKTEIVHDLEFSEIYEDIEHHRFVTADEYLSGDIRGRMEYLEEQLDDWTEELHELAASEIIDLPSGEYPFFSEKDFPELYDEETHKLYPRKLTNEQMAQLFEPENREKALFFLNNVSTYWLNDVIKYAKLGNPNLAQKFDDPAFAFEFWRSGKVNDNFMPLYSFHGFNMLDVAYDNIQAKKSRMTEPVSELAIHAFLKKISDDYAHGTHPEVFSREYIDENFESFAKDFDARIAEKSENISGDIAESLRDDIARAKKNLAALEKVKPKDLTADEIDIFLGAPWVKTDDIKQFAVDTFGYGGSIEVEYSDISGAWKVSTGYSGGLNQADSVYGIKNRNAFELLQAALNHTQINVMKEVSDAKGGTKRVINREQTLLAARKIQDIRDAFHNWIFKDEERKDRYVSYYNRHFNNIVPRHFDGSRLTFPGMNPEIELRPHQKDAVARTLFGGNTLLAHVVGAGKTFEMQASAMESKRIGLCHKSMMIMPKHLTQQFGSEFQRLYPNAKILVAEPKDFTAAGRQEFCAKIMAKDWDAVVLSYEQFGKIPLSFERRSKFLQDEAHKILNAIDEMKKNKGKRFTIKQAEREYKKIKDQLEKLEEDYHKHQDSTLTFEQLGIDRLYVDESHFYKNLGFFTCIPGIQSNHVQKTDDMLAKCDYINELTNERGIVFASGTPVSNSMAELYTLSRYLKPSRLKSQGLEAFDSWASTFGDQVTQMELEPAGDKFRQKTRFSHFANVPELVSMFKEFADVKLADQLKLPVPNSHLKLITAEPSQVQRGMIDDLIERSDFIKKGNPKIVNEEAHKVDEAKGIDNMLNITREGREIALDPRLIDPELPDYPESKLNLCVNNVVKIYKDTADKKSTQLVFCDIGTPSTDKKKFSVYDDIKEKLMAQGIKEKEIAFIHSYETPKKKEELFKKVRKGEVRVLLGSSDKLGVGTNVQDKIVAMHELDCPWKPAQIEQRRGRGIRVGNENSDVDIYRYVTKGTFDAYMWQTNEFKQKFISQVMTSTAPSRVCDDVDDFQLEASQIKTACTENPLFQEQMSLDNEVRILKMERAQFYDSRKTLEHLLTILPAEIQNADKKLNFVNDDLSLYEKGEGKGFVVGDKEYKGKEIGMDLQSKCNSS